MCTPAVFVDLALGFSTVLLFAAASLLSFLQFTNIFFPEIANIFLLNCYCFQE